MVLLATAGWWTVGCTTFAQASFRQSTSASPAYGSGTLQPPASASATCTSSGSTATATVSWTASPSTRVGGYRVTSTPATSSVTATSTARSATVSGLSKGASYTFTVVATLGTGWVSTGRTTTSTAC